MPGFIPYSRQWIDEEDVSEVVRVLKSDWITQGPKIKEFEQKLAQYCGAKYAVAVSSGTAALHLACLAAGFSQADEVITSPITFLASANCVLYCGGKPVFADIDPRSYNIDPVEIKKHITPKTKGIIPVHFAGYPCQMKEIKAVAQEHNLIVVEDACHALGAEYYGEKVGSCKYSQMTVFSFHPVKHITTGEGGAVLTNDSELHYKLLCLRNHGMTKDPDRLIRNEGRWYYEMQELGYNYRITDLQCTLGISQLKKLDDFVRERRRIARQYNESFLDIEWITTPVETNDRVSSYHLYPVQIEFEKIGKTRNQVMTELFEKKIGTQVHYIPVPLQPFYREKYGYKRGDFPYAEEYYKKALSLPLFPSLKEEEVDYVIANVVGLYSNQEGFKKKD